MEARAATAGVEPTLPRRGLFRGWLLANAAALAAGGVLFVIVAVVAAVTGLDRDDGGRQPVFGLVLGLTFGLTLGVAQARVLHGRIRRHRAWAVATAGGVVAGTTLIFGALDHGSGIPDAAQVVLHPLAMAVTTGVPQAWVLRGEIERSWRWVLLAGVAWGAGAALALPVPVVGLGLALIALVATAIEGFALAHLAPAHDPFALPR